MPWTSADISKLAASVFASAVLCLAMPLGAIAHTPHDIITDIAVEPTADTDGQVFILVTDQLFRSDNRNSPWKNLDNGLDIQHPFVSLAMSPNYAEDNTIHVATSGDGVFRSVDRGETWARINFGLDDLDISQLLSWTDANDPSLLAAAAKGGLWQRDGREDAWRQVLSKRVAVTSLSTARAENDARVLLAGDKQGRIWRSDDGGRLWAIVSQLADAGAITAIAASVSTVVVGTERQGLYLSENGAQDFVHVGSFAPQRTHDCRGRMLEEPLSDNHVTSIVLSPTFERDSTVYATTWYNGVWISSDTGTTWSTWSDRLSCDRQADTEGLPHFRKVAVAAAANASPVYWLAAFDGLFRAVQPMSAWQQLETLPLGLIKGFAVTGNDRQEPVVALATYGGGFYITHDLGRQWTVGNKGLQTTRLTGITFSQDYASDRQIFAGAHQRLHWSEDGGQSWNKVYLQRFGLGARLAFKLSDWGAPTGVTRALYDPGSSGPVYPTHIVTQDPPKQAQVLFGTRFHGLMSYDVDGDDIETVWDGTDRIMNTFLRSPDFAADQTLFASVRGEGLIRSSDSGESWTPINAGLDFVTGWSDDPDGSNFRRDVQLAISPGFKTDNILFAGSPAGSGLYVSKNGGDTWKQLSLLPGQPRVVVLAVAVSPNFVGDNTLIVSVKGHGLFRSNDAGASFQPIGEDLRRANASIEFLAFSARYASDGLAIAASDEELFVSSDGGETWRAVDRPVRYEDMRNVIEYDGEWNQVKGDNFSAMTQTTSTVAGSSVQLRFFGTGVRWIGAVGPDKGRAQVSIDGKLHETVSSRANRSATMQVLFSVQDLPLGAHTIELRLVSDTAGEETAPITLDAFDVLSDRQAAH